MCIMHIVKKHLFFLVILTSLANSASAEYGYESYPRVFYAVGGPKCGNAFDEYRALAIGEYCNLVLRAGSKFKTKLRYWIEYRPLGKETYRRISPIKTFTSKTGKGFEFFRFKMHGDGRYHVVLDKNSNFYPDDYADLGLFFKLPAYKE